MILINQDEWIQLLIRDTFDGVDHLCGEKDPELWNLISAIGYLFDWLIDRK